MIRVLIASPVRLVADLLEVVIKNQADMQVVGYVASAQAALEQKSTCDVIMASVTLPNDETTKLLNCATQWTPLPRVVVFGAPATEPVLMHYLEEGAASCVCSSDSVEQLLQAIRAAAHCEINLSPRLAALVRERIVELAEQCRSSEMEDESPTSRALTLRERQVLELIAQGCRNHEIAERLTIELGTTKNHVHNILSKLKVTRRRDAVAYWSMGLHQSNGM